MHITLDRLKPGMGATVTQIDTEDVLRRRLEDFGLVPGTPVRCLYRSPYRDVSALNVRGSVLALRRRDLLQITAIT